jgi:hemoglobin
MPVMYDFWESVLLDGSNYKGNPMLKHIALNKKAKLEKAHFEQWLHLWNNTIKSKFEGPVAEMAFVKAKLMAALMQYKIDQSMSKGYIL